MPLCSRDKNILGFKSDYNNVNLITEIKRSLKTCIDLLCETDMTCLY